MYSLVVIVGNFYFIYWRNKKPRIKKRNFIPYAGAINPYYWGFLKVRVLLWNWMIKNLLDMIANLPTYSYYMALAYILCWVFVVFSIYMLIFNEILQYIYYIINIIYKHYYIKNKPKYQELREETLLTLKCLNAGWYCSAWITNDLVYFNSFYSIAFIQLLIFYVVKHSCDVIEYVAENEPTDIKIGNLKHYLNEKYGPYVIKTLRRQFFEVVSLSIGIFMICLFILGICLFYKEAYKINIPYGIYWVPPLQICLSCLYVQYWIFLDKNPKIKLYHKNCVVSFTVKLWLPYIFLYGYSYLFQWIFWAELHNILFLYIFCFDSLPFVLVFLLFLNFYGNHLYKIFEEHYSWAFETKNNYELHSFVKEVLYSKDLYKNYIKLKNWIDNYIYSIFFIFSINLIIINLIFLIIYKEFIYYIIIFNKINYFIYLYIFFIILKKELPKHLFIKWMLKTISVFFLVHNEVLVYNIYFWSTYSFLTCCVWGPYFLTLYAKFRWGKSIFVLSWLIIGLILNKHIYLRLVTQLLTVKCKVKPFDFWRIWRIYVINTQNIKRMQKLKIFLDRFVKIGFLIWTCVWVYSLKDSKFKHVDTVFWKYLTIIMFTYVLYNIIKSFFPAKPWITIFNQIDKSVNYHTSQFALALRWSPWIAGALWIIDQGWKGLIFTHHKDAYMIALVFYLAVLEFLVFFFVEAHKKRGKALKAFLVKYRYRPSIYGLVKHIRLKTFCKDCLYFGLSGLACLFFFEFVFAYYKIEFTIWTESFFILWGMNLYQNFCFYCKKYEKYGLKFLAWYSYWFAKDPIIIFFVFCPLLYNFTGSIFFNTGAYFFVERGLNFLTTDARWYLVKFINIFSFFFFFISFYCAWELSQWTREHFFHKREGLRFDYEYLRKTTYRYFLIHDLGLQPYLYNVVTKAWMKSFFWRRVIQTFFQIKFFMFCFYFNKFSYDITWRGIQNCLVILFFIQLIIWVWKKSYPNCAARLKFYYYEFLFCNANYFDIWFIGCLSLFFPLWVYGYFFIISIFVTFLIRPFYFYNTKWEDVYRKKRNYVLAGFEIDYIDHKELVFEDDEAKILRVGYRNEDLLYAFKIKDYVTVILSWVVWFNSVVLTFGLALNFYPNSEVFFWVAIPIHIFSIFCWYLFREFWKLWYFTYHEDVTYYIGNFFHNLSKFDWLFYFIHFSILWVNLGFGHIYGIIVFFNLQDYVYGQLDTLIYTWCLCWLVSTYLFYEEPKVINNQFHWWFTFYFKKFENWVIQKFDKLVLKIIKSKKRIYKLCFCILYYYFYYYINWILLFIGIILLIIFIFYREK